MTYSTLADLASDPDITRRVTACAATLGEESPSVWVASQAWQLAAQPGWDTAYEAARKNETPFPGRDEAVITDAMILAAVQALTDKTL